MVFGEHNKKDLSGLADGSAESQGRPLVVDLDNTLIRTDLLIDSAFTYIARRPSNMLNLIGWLTKGKAHLKFNLASVVEIDPAVLPYSQVVMDRIDAARLADTPVYLASASNELYVRRVYDYLSVFDGWFASDGVVNLSGEAKADLLVRAFGNGGFDYIGDSAADLPVWAKAGAAIAIAPSSGVLRRLKRVNSGALILPKDREPRSSIKSYIKVMRPHQWAKNGLVFIPLLAAHAFGWLPLLKALIAFVAFSACASSVYILNDLLDVSADRAHPTKRRRPFAAGDISPVSGAVMAPALLLIAFLLAFTLPAAFPEVLALYYVATSAYSFILKRKLMIDVVTLAGLYTVRLVGGGAATSLPISEWLLAFAIFIFLCLAILKRYTEMAVRLDRNLPDPSNRNYKVTDLPVLIALAAAAGYSSVIVCALYMSSPAIHNLYRHPKWLYIVCPLILYWISRAIMMTHRREMHDDPIVFALRDRISLAIALLIGLVAAAAL